MVPWSSTNLSLMRKFNYFKFKNLQQPPDLDEAEVELASEVVGESPVVVVDSQVGRAHLQHFNVSESFHDCSQF